MKKDRNRYIIPQVDDTVDSRDSFNQTPDSIDLTKSPVKYKNTQRDTEKSNEDASDNDIDKMIKFNTYIINTQYCKSIQKLKVTLLFIQEEV